MTIAEKAAYLKGLAEGLGMEPQSREGRLWAALNDLLGDIAHELEDLRETDRGQAQALDGVADELSYLEELCGGFDSEDEADSPVCGGCSRPCMADEAEPARLASDDADDAEDGEDELKYDGVVYDATCPVCGEEISFDEQTLERGSIQCPKCGEILEFDLGEDAEADKPAEDGPKAEG